MTAAAMVRNVIASGITLKLDGDRLVLSAAKRPDDQLVQKIRSQKPRIIKYLRDLSCWGEDDWQALFDERAGIIEFDGARSPADAEVQAELEVATLRELVAKDRPHPADARISPLTGDGGSGGDVDADGVQPDDIDLRIPEFLDRVKHPIQGDLPTYSWVSAYPSGGLIRK